MTTRLFQACAVAYLLAQAAGIVAWWLWLHASSQARARFAPAGSEHALMAFAPGDLLMLSGVSLVAAVGVARGTRWAGALLWCHAGACVYASCWAISISLHEPARAIGAIMMTPVLVASVVIAAGWSRGTGKSARGAA